MAGDARAQEQPTRAADEACGPPARNDEVSALPAVEASPATSSDGKRRRLTIDNQMEAAFNPHSKKIHWAATADKDPNTLCSFWLASAAAVLQPIQTPPLGATWCGLCKKMCAPKGHLALCPDDSVTGETEPQRTQPQSGSEAEQDAAPSADESSCATISEPSDAEASGR